MGQELVTTNSTLKDWHPKKPSVDDLLRLSESETVLRYFHLFAVCVAYQFPDTVQFKETEVVLAARTFEAALIFKKPQLFPSVEGVYGGHRQIQKDHCRVCCRLRAPRSRLYRAQESDQGGFRPRSAVLLQHQRAACALLPQPGIAVLQSELKRKQSDNFPAPVWKKLQTKDEMELFNRTIGQRSFSTSGASFGASDEDLGLDQTRGGRRGGARCHRVSFDTISRSLPTLQ